MALLLLQSRLSLWRNRARALRLRPSQVGLKTSRIPILPWKARPLHRSWRTLLHSWEPWYRADEPHGSTWYLEQMNSFHERNKEAAVVGGSKDEAAFMIREWGDIARQLDDRRSATAFHRAFYILILYNTIGTKRLTEFSLSSTRENQVPKLALVLVSFLVLREPSTEDHWVVSERTKYQNYPVYFQVPELSSVPSERILSSTLKIYVIRRIMVLRDDQNPEEWLRAIEWEDGLLEV